MKKTHQVIFGIESSYVQVFPITRQRKKKMKRKRKMVTKKKTCRTILGTKNSSMGFFFLKLG